MKSRWLVFLLALMGCASAVVPVARADFRPALARIELDRGQVPPGEAIRATYTFRSNGPSQSDMVVFVHVVRPDGQRIGADFAPQRSTMEWPADRFVQEGPQPIGVPAGSPPGKYRVLVGMVPTTPGPRVEMANPDRHQGDREYLAGEFEVLRAAAKSEAKPVTFELLPVDPARLVKAPPPEPPGPPLELAGEVLKVAMDSRRPVVLGYEHRPSGSKFPGTDGRGVLMINGNRVRWQRWQIDVRKGEKEVVYAMSLPAEQLAFDCAFSLKGNTLAMELRNIADPRQNLKTIQWQDLPLVAIGDPEYHFWRLTTSGPDQGGKMWMGDQAGQLRTSGPHGPQPAVYGCLYRPEKLCVFVYSNYPLFPQTHQITAERKYAIALSTYQYRVRNKTMPPLRAEVVFLGDINHDGRADLSDYCLWVNRRLPEIDPIYHTHLWYKIFCDLPACGVRTTFKQSEEMIRAIHNVTDGLPQIVYLVGWQYTGHDTGYPAMDKVNERIGGAEGLRELARAAKQHNTILSYHSNIDDCYPENPGYDKRFCTRNGICHTLDAETGSIFRRLEAMMKVAPVERTLHFDNLRITNTVPLGCPDGIGVLEELVCGMVPIMDWLRERGITVTTEGQNGAPIDLTQILAGVWHWDTSLTTCQLWHRKLVGGGTGSRVSGPSRADCATVGSIHQDFSYDPLDRQSVSEETWKKEFSWFNGPRGLTVAYKTEWPEIVDRIYRGVLLYQFFLEREMTNVQGIPGGSRIEYGNREVVAELANNRLKVTMGDVLVADDDDRFMPRGDAIYCYSAGGSERDWTLPEKFRGKPLEVFTLSKTGRGPAPEFRVEANRVHLKLAPRAPVKIIAKPDRPGQE